MKLFMVDTYDRWREGNTCNVPEHIGRVLCRNANFFAIPADEKTLKICEATGDADYRQLQRWCKHLELDASGKSDDLRDELLAWMGEKPARSPKAVVEEDDE